jgi:APA family basic amino acid/polyamine antiporter
MAQRIPRDESLSRVHGVGALFSAAYGNVGSSIYYALGVTAAFALGLTPVAFVISGLIFAATAATYAEATVMYPEAGGSSSFARHAFNEMVSFIAAWGQMLNYTITVAISAFFVPHYLAVFWPWLGNSPGDIVGGAVLIVALALINIRGTEESPTSRPRSSSSASASSSSSAPRSWSTTSTSASPRPGATSPSGSRSE